MSRINLAVLLVVGLLLVTAKQSMQMSLRNPTAEIETSNCKLTVLRVGLVFTSDHNEKAVIDSGLFRNILNVDIAGRRFHVGTLKNTPIVYVKTGTQSVNVATAVQILLLKFHISGIVFFGNAGSLDKTYVPGTVVVPDAVAFTGVWEWEEFRAQNKGQLAFGHFNYPVNGENSLGTVAYENITLYSPSEDPEEVFWLPIPLTKEAATEELTKGLKLKECHSGRCQAEFEIIYGSKASTSDFYVKNEAYGGFLVTEFDASTADSASAAVALTALSNEKPFVVIQGVSNVVGVDGSYPELASHNAFLVATLFVESFPTQRLACE
ncbi:NUCLEOSIDASE putative-RELATED [Salix purpurea]|uniref:NUCLEOSIDASE putative-RELATED n=1 Tax=Salix purpurea TaxID=77065 RepID=A0A9Q0WD53_SALPP|nr:NUCLEOSIDASE putative-RELATED [Salix purpurea]